MGYMRSLSEYLGGIFPGKKVQKIGVNAFLGCPNRDGTVGRGGCIYCNNAAFTPSYAMAPEGISRQLEDGIKFFSVKSAADIYLAYFQSFSNTYGPLEKLTALYEEALAYPGVSGLILATRPDTLSPDLLDYLESRFGNKAPDGHPFLLVELGVESTKDETLKRINRGHDWACARRAIIELAGRGIPVGVHIIIGLPGENREDYLRHARLISELPVTTIKLHQLQVIRGTSLEQMYLADPDSVPLLSAEQYAAVLRDFLPLLRPDIVVDRLVSESPSSLLIAPRWGLKPAQLLARLGSDPNQK